MDSEFVTWNAPWSDHPARLMGKKSYHLVATKQRDAWIDLFTEDAIVQDPVGPSMFDPEGTGHVGHEAIGAFWDKAIAMVDHFQFTINDSFANGRTNCNVAVFSTWIGEDRIDTELVTIHEVNATGDKLVSMRAYWEPERAFATMRKESR